MQISVQYNMVHNAQSSLRPVTTSVSQLLGSSQDTDQVLWGLCEDRGRERKGAMPTAYYTLATVLIDH